MIIRNQNMTPIPVFNNQDFDNPRTLSLPLVGENRFNTDFNGSFNPTFNGRFNQNNTTTQYNTYARHSIDNDTNPSGFATPTFEAGWGGKKQEFGDDAYKFADVMKRLAPPPLQLAPEAPPTPTVPPLIRQTVAVNEHASYWGDPHVADPDRADKDNKRQDSFVVKGDGVFNLLSDNNINLNAQHKKYDAFGIEVTDQIGLKIPYANITFSAYGVPQLNGGALTTGQTVTLFDKTQVTWDGTTLSVKSGSDGEYDLAIGVVTSGNKNPDGSAIKYLDTDVNTKSQGVGNDGRMPEGILGETFDADTAQNHALKKDISTYKRAGLLD